MSDQPAPPDTQRRPKWAVELVERLGIAEHVGDHWERSARRDAGRRQVKVRCMCGKCIASYGLSSPVKGGHELSLVEDDPEPGPVQFLDGREPRMRVHATHAWLTMSRIVWECKKCGFSRPTTRLALQEAVEGAIATGRSEVVLGLDL